MPQVDNAQRQLFGALERLDSGDGGSASTSLRVPRPLHDALTAAVALGLDDSFNGAAGASIEAAVRAFAKDLALRLHYEEYPEDRPTRAEVAAARLRGTADPLASREDLLVKAEEWLTERGREVSVETVMAVAQAWLETAVA